MLLECDVRGFTNLFCSIHCEGFFTEIMGGGGGSRALKLFLVTGGVRGKEGLKMDRPEIFMLSISISLFPLPHIK